MIIFFILYDHDHVFDEIGSCTYILCIFGNTHMLPLLHIIYLFISPLGSSVMAKRFNNEIGLKLPKTNCSDRTWNRFVERLDIKQGLK